MVEHETTANRWLRRSIALAFVMTLITAACSPVPSGTPSAPAASPPGPAATPGAVASPPVDPSLALGAWTETFSRELFGLGGIVAGPHGLIAPGCVASVHGDCLRGVLLTSPDGTSWTELELEGAADTSIGRVRRVGDRLFAIGQWHDGEGGKIEPVVWTSLDGRSWSRIPLASSRNRSISDIIDSPVGTIAVGIHAPIDSEGFGFVVWDVEPDGSFGEPRDVKADSNLVWAQGAVWAGNRYLAWGLCWACPRGEKVQSIMLLASPDGRAWTVLPEIAAFHNSSVSEILDMGDWLVAVGYKGRSLPTSPQAWTSVDGETWEMADVPPDAGAMYTVQVEGPQLVARGQEQWEGEEVWMVEHRPASWTSTDGEVWTRLPGGEDMPDLSGFSSLTRAMVDGRACVAGTFSGDPRRPEPRAAIYCRR